MATTRSSPPPAEGDAIETGDNFLSPRSKVAKMLADIDDAPTPSPPSRLPTPKAKLSELGPFQDDSDNDSGGEAQNQQQHSKIQPGPHSGYDESEDEDEIVRKPQGRAARKMLGLEGNAQQEESTDSRTQPSASESEEDLYSATPIRPSSLKRRRAAMVRAASGSPLAPQSQRGSGLFVSPTKTVLEGSDGEDDDLPTNPLNVSKARLANLVAQKRAERITREKEEADRRRKVARFESGHASGDLPEEVFERSQDAAQNPDVDRILSDAARPTRKASKKAMLEMERETQRIARQQALAHQMKVKKKFSTNDLFAKFNFRQAQNAPQADSQSSSAPNSDSIQVSPVASVPREPVSTPPSSPPTPFDKQRMLVEQGALAKMSLAREDSLATLAAEEDQQLPNIDEIVKSSQMQKQRSAATVVGPTKNQDTDSADAGSKIARREKNSTLKTYRADDSDDDLEVLEPLPKHLQVFDRIKPAKKAENHSKAIHTLRHLSHIGQYDTKPNRRGVKPSVHPSVIEAQLRRRAKEQARQAQQERLAELKAKGIVVQTAEEREREADDYENLLEKARQEAQDIKKAEKAARKSAGGEENMQASEDESEDEEYVASGSEEASDADREGNDLVDDAADESENGEDEEAGGVSLEDEVMEEDAAQSAEDHFVATGTTPMELNTQTQTPAPKRRMPRKSRVIEEDDDEDNSPEKTTAAMSVASETEDPFAAFGFGGVNPGANLMSPTQAFNATMQTPTQEHESQENSFHIFKRIAPPSGSAPPPTLPVVETQSQIEASQDQTPSAQMEPESQEVQLDWETQAPETPVPGLTRKASGLSETPGWEPSQDPGLPSPWTAARRAKLRRESTLDSVAGDYETQDTVQLRVSESPIPAPLGKRGRLMQRRQVTADDSDEDIVPVKPSQKDAFKAMKRRRIDTLNASERAEAKAEMKRMMDEQAEESEDEYVGLGGDDTEMIAPETAEDQAMIDSSHINVDERAIAAHYAERQRMSEEEATKKLYKDLTTGALRRRQGASFDLDEDEDDIAVRRRQMRQREEARKRRLLLQDDNVKDWAERGKQNKGKDAFLRAMADDDDADDVVDLDDEEQDSQEPSTQDESQATEREAEMKPLQETSGNKRRAEDEEGNSLMRPPAKQRRTNATEITLSRPTSLLQVRESLSFLLDEPSQPDLEPSPLSDEDDDFPADFEADDVPQEAITEDHPSDDEEIAAEYSRQNDGGYAPNPKEMEDKAKMPPPRLPASLRRTVAPAPAVVDRLSLKRGSSSNSSDGSGAGRSAWATGAGSGFKAPSLLRRATTNMTTSGANDRGVSIGGGSGGGNARGVTIGGGGARGGSNKKSSLAYQARTEERKAIVEASARRRAEHTGKIAELRRSSTGGLRGLGGSGFE